MSTNRNFIGLLFDGAKSNRLLWALIGGFALFPIFTHFADLPFWNDVAMRIMLLGMAAMGLNLVLGYGGMVSFGHAAFVGIGAYCVSISQFYGITNGWAHLGLSVVTCGFAGLVVGYLALRTSGIYFIMITLAFAQMLFFLFVSLEAYGGDDGMSIDRGEFDFIDLYDPVRLYFLIWCALALVSLVLMFIVRSRFGVTLRAIKSNESRVEAMGLSPLRFKMVGYLISAVICGIAGSLFANWQEYLNRLRPITWAFARQNSTSRSSDGDRGTATSPAPRHFRGTRRRVPASDVSRARPSTGRAHRVRAPPLDPALPLKARAVDS